MTNEKIQNQINFLLKHAITRCENMTDAQDLVQKTILAKLVYEKKGGVISDENGCLSASVDGEV